MMYCPYHNVDHPDGTTFSDEHIIPSAVGGSDQFTIRVCKPINDKYGTNIDAPLIDNFFIASERILRNLDSHSKKSPAYTFRGEVDLDGKSVSAEYHVSAVDRKLWIKPRVERQLSGEQESIRIECTQEQLPEIIKNINKKRKKDGKEEIPDSAFLKGAIKKTIPKPSMQTRSSVDMSAFQRGFAKFALATAHFIFGELYTRSSEADLLRKFIEETNSDARERIPQHGSAWPDSDPKLLESIAFKDWHFAMILNTGPLIFFGALFGRYDGYIQLSTDVNKYSVILPAGQGLIYLVNPADRKLRKFTYGDYLLKRSQGLIS